jgi:hypothetical protein
VQVQDLSKAADEFESLPAMIDYDIRNNSVRDGGSHTRNLLRVLRGVDMVRLLFQQILITEGNTLKGPASKAYDQVFARHHSWTIRKAVGAGMFLLPSKSQFLKKLNEEGMCYQPTSCSLMRILELYRQADCVSILC